MAHEPVAQIWTRTNHPMGAEHAPVSRARRLLLALSRTTSAIAISLALLSSAPASAQPVKGTAQLTAAGGFARLELKLADEVDTDVSVAGSVLLVRFRKPVDVSVARLSDAAPDYISSARRDPDGSAMRFALRQKVKVNTIPVGDRIFIDLMPDSWKGPNPSLPQEVIMELAERARAAERALRQRNGIGENRPLPPIRVRAAVQPTFVRYSFEIPQGVDVKSTRSDRLLVIDLNAGLTFDLADAKISMPPNVGSINAHGDSVKSSLEISLLGETDVRTFREGNSYFIDVGDTPGMRRGGVFGLPQVPAPPAGQSPSQAPSNQRSSLPADQKSERNDPQKAAAGDDDKQPKLAAASPSPADASPASVAALSSPADKPAAEVPVAASDATASKPDAQSKNSIATAPAAVSEGKTVNLSDARAQMQRADAVAAAAKFPTREMEMIRSSEGIKLSLNFDKPTPVSLFKRGDVVWLVIDSLDVIDISQVRMEGGALVSGMNIVRFENGQVIRFRLDRPRLASLTSDDTGSGSSWTINLADSRVAPSQPLSTTRNIADRTTANVTIQLARPGRIHKLLDPEAGDTLTVITALPPSRGFIRKQDFVEFNIMETIHGVAIQRKSDEIKIAVNTDKVTISRSGGLTLSAAESSHQRASVAARPIFDVGQWRADQQGSFTERLDDLILALSLSDQNSRNEARFNLARFYMARGMFHEAKALMDLALADAKFGQESPTALVIRAAANAVINRADEALKDVNHPSLAAGYDSEMWRGLALAKQGSYVAAREKFLNAGLAISSLPPDLQRIVVAEAMRASLEVKDYSGAAQRAAELDLAGLPGEWKYHGLLLQGWLDEALGHEQDALSKYELVINSDVRPAAAEAKLREIALKLKRKEISPQEAVRDVELLSVTWRGDRIETATLQMLARLYNDLGRYGDSLTAARSATEREAVSDAARQVQDEASALFAQIFLSNKAEQMPAIDALAMFYQFRELTPIGRRGDEMIRRLADRLVDVDLLDQASELLQYQIDNRLEGAARSRVAARLAMVYLMNRKPERAIAALHSSRISELSGELRQQRLLLEARAQSDIGRRDLALDIISNLHGQEAVRLRSDIYWAARRWREAAEQIELYYGDRWRSPKPLTTAEKGDVIRAVVGYALAEDALGLARFREKYAPLMTSPADQAAFNVATTPASSNSSQFAAIAKMAAGVDTLDGFMREMRNRFPDVGAGAQRQPAKGEVDRETTGSIKVRAK